MQTVVSNITVFIDSILLLYNPLPFELTADLNTLNSYLRQYDSSKQKTLASFVKKIAEKAQQKKKQVQNSELQNISIKFSPDQSTQGLRHYNSCALRYPQFKLNLDHFKDQADILNKTQKVRQTLHSQRSRKQGIISARQKFGNQRDRTKLNKYLDDFNKENCSMDSNAIKQVIAVKEQNLVSMKSDADILSNNSSFNFRKHSADVAKGKKIDNLSRNKPRYQSGEPRSTNGMSLKIKLKPKPLVDYLKISEGLSDAMRLIEKQDQQIKQLFQGFDIKEEQNQ